MLPLEKLSFTLCESRGQLYIQTGKYYAPSKDGTKNGSSHRSDTTLEDAIKLLTELYEQVQPKDLYAN